MISAPRSARYDVPKGPAPYCSTARTRRPDTGSFESLVVIGIQLDLAQVTARAPARSSACRAQVSGRTPPAHGCAKSEAWRYQKTSRALLRLTTGARRG